LSKPPPFPFRGIMDVTMPKDTPEVQLRQEFNRWAKKGRGEEMEGHHLPKTFSLSSRHGSTGLLGFPARA
jgi:hypothetical protein